MNRADLEKMSGETTSSPRLTLNKLQFSGKTNTFEFFDIKGGLIDLVDKHGKPNGKKGFASEKLGEEVSVIFLRIRRKLMQFRKEQSNLVTNEHNTKHDMLNLYGDEKVVKGGNDELKEKYPLLRTIQVMYCLLKRGEEYELVRLNIKGSSLGSESKAKEVMDFYQYIQSFKSEGADEHFYEYETDLFGVEEENSLGSYYSMTFKKGRKLTDEEIDNVVVPNMTTVFNFVTQSDEYYKTKKDEVAEVQRPTVNGKDEIDTIDYGDEDINLEDIPF